MLQVAATKNLPAPYRHTYDVALSKSTITMNSNNTPAIPVSFGKPSLEVQVHRYARYSDDDLRGGLVLL